MDMFENARTLLPPWMREELKADAYFKAEELHLRRGRRPTAVIGGRETPFSERSVTESDISACLEKMSCRSMHCAMPQLLQGYFSCRGVRIGVCGTAVYERGELTALRDISSLNIRIPHEIRAELDALFLQLMPFESSLIIAPPGVGKTTALRELIRLLSDGGYRVGVCDERNELGASERGQPQFELGACTDLMTGMKKEQAVTALLRGMSPDIIALDEITKSEDAKTLISAAGCGVKLLATAHAADMSDLTRRAVYRELLSLGEFKNLISVRIVRGRRHYDRSRL